MFFDTSELWKNIVLQEAEDDEYQMGELETNTEEETAGGDTPQTEGEGGEENAPGEEDTADEEAPDEGEGGDPSIASVPEDGGEGETEGAPGENPEEGENSTEVGDETPNEEGEPHKKIVLFDQYRQILDTISQLTTTLKEVHFTEPKLIEEGKYLNDKLQELSDQLEYAMTKKFLKESYKNLLKLYFYFKYRLYDIVKLTRKIFEMSDIGKK